MGKFIFGLIVGLIIIPLFVYLYFSTGMAPVATNSAPMPFEKWFAGMALHAGMGKAAQQQSPLPADETNLTAGAQVYRDHCAVCHGLPLTPDSAIAKGMYPKPPKLMEGKGVTDDSPGETYWKVNGGIRMTGMPGFQNSLSTNQMWQVSLLCANADKLPSATKSLLVSGPAAAAAPATSATPVPPATPK
jgi:thiosulfate dehydrogenase